MLTWPQSARNPVSKDLNFKDFQVQDAPPQYPLQGTYFSILYLEPKLPSLKSQTLPLQGVDAPQSPLQGTYFSSLYL